MNEAKGTNSEKMVAEIVSVPTINSEPDVVTNTELAPLSSTSLQHFDKEKQEEILRIADEIDVLELEKVMSYGQIPLLRSFESAGKVLKELQGTNADQEVMKQVIEMAKQASDSYEDFNLVLKEPNILEKLILKVSSAIRGEKEGEINLKAITCYKFLEQFRDSCESWIEMLQQAYKNIVLSADEDRAGCYELEQYIVAGYIAEERIKGEVEKAKNKWEETGLIEAKNNYDTRREGLDTLRVVLLNLEKSRAAYGISIGQLALKEKANKNIQIAIRTQKANSMALTAQQLRNAILDAQNREALDGQKSIARLNDELMKKVASSAVLTAEESEKILLNGVYTIESALVAAKTVIDGCQSIEKARSERLGNIAQEMTKLKTLVDELAPYIDNLQQNNNNSSTGSQISSTTGGLVF